MPEVDSTYLHQLATPIEAQRTALAAMPSRVCEDSVVTIAQVVNGDGATFPPTNIVDDFLRRVSGELVSD